MIQTSNFKHVIHFAIIRQSAASAIHVVAAIRKTNSLRQRQLVSPLERTVVHAGFFVVAKDPTSLLEID